MNMTDHKYPNEIASCHNMLKKRDAIIEQLQAKNQPGVDTENLRKEFDRCHEELGIYKRDNETLKKTIDELERGANLKYENRIEELEADLEAAKKMASGEFLDKNEQIALLEEKNAALKADSNAKPVEGNMVLLKNQIAEQKRDILAHMNKIDELLVEVKDYRDFKHALDKVLSNGD